MSNTLISTIIDNEGGSQIAARHSQRTCGSGNIFSVLTYIQRPFLLSDWSLYHTILPVTSLRSSNIFYALQSKYYFVFVYTDLVKTVEEECKYLVFSIIFKCRFQHLRDLIQNLRGLNWRVALDEYFLRTAVCLWGSCSE